MIVHYNPGNVHCTMLYTIVHAEHGLHAMECTPLKAFPFTYGQPIMFRKALAFKWKHYALYTCS